MWLAISWDPFILSHVSVLMPIVLICFRRSSIWDEASGCDGEYDRYNLCFVIILGFIFHLEIVHISYIRI